MLILLGFVLTFIGICLCTCIATALTIVSIFAVVSQIILADADAVLFLLEKFGPDPGETELDEVAHLRQAILSPRVTGLRVSRKVVWVTGASRGIGAAIAVRLARYGTKVVLSSRDETRLHRVKELCVEAGARPLDVLVLPLDILKHDTHSKALLSVLEHFKKVDVLVSNAGRSQRAKWDAIDIAVDRDIFELNVFSLISLTRILNKHFRETGGGHHVVTSSTAGKLGAPRSASYSGSKHALHGYFECLRLEGAADKIDVTMLCPGPVETDLLQHCYTEHLGQSLNKDRTGTRMSAERCAVLSVAAMAYKLPEVWICQQPVLLLHYVVQYCPLLLQLLMRLVGLGYAMSLRDGHAGAVPE